MMLKQMKKNNLITTLALAMFTVYIVSGCKKIEDPLIIDEPITFILPDTNRISAKPGDDIPLTIQLTTDKAIDSFACQYQIDTTNHGFDPTVDIANDYFKVGFRDSMNLIVWDGVYHMPSDTFLDEGDVVRLVYTLEARQDIFYQKILRIDVK